MHLPHQRARGFQTLPYPCIGQFRFLTLTLPSHPLYRTIVSRLQNGETYLDVGCCFGQDLRQLVKDGVPSSKLIGLDVDGRLMDLGHEMFHDRGKLQSRFIVADVFNRTENAWVSLEGSIDVAHASAFFHLFPLADQIAAAEQIVRVMRPRSGSMIIGRQAGSVKPRELPSIKKGETSFRHNMDTLRSMWQEVGNRTGTRWDVQGTMDSVGIRHTHGKDAVVYVQTRPDWVDADMRRILFTITRL